jgi:YidC/Oxa1 family membrane protein insertase
MDFQRIIAFVVFSFSLIMLWESWQDYNNPNKAKHVATQAAAPGAAVPAPTTGKADVPTPGQALQQQAAPVTGGAEKGARAVVKTDVMTAVIDAHGGDIRELTLPAYRQNEDTTKLFKLFEERAKRDYFAQSGFVGAALPNHKTVFELIPGDYTLKTGENTLKLPMKAVTPEGVEVIKTYTFTRGSYVIDVDTQVVNRGAAPVEGFPYYQIMRHGQAPEGESKFTYTFTGPAMFTDEGKYQKVKFEDITKGKTDHIKTATDGWMGMVQHHFVSAWMPRDPADKSKREFYTRALGNDEFSAGVIMPAVKVAPGATQTASMRLYAGPQDQETLKTLAPGLEHVVDYGWLTVLAYPIFLLLNFLEDLVHNWGVAIILLTVLIKGAFYPLSAASYKSMAQMRKLGPRLQQMKERYGDDRQKLHEEMMKVYKEEKINPLGGCLPILVQIPVFIALYWVLLSAVELRQAPFALWITDLSQKDPYFILPVVMAVTMFIQQKLSPTPPDPVQAKVMMMMPIIFSVMFLFFPAGLVLYWLVNNVLSILQQWRINHVIEKAGHGKAAAKS